MNMTTKINTVVTRLVRVRGSFVTAVLAAYPLTR